jgi:hypothetical protein
VMGVLRGEGQRSAAAAFLYVVAVLAAVLGGGAFEDGTAVYIVTMKRAPVFHRRLDLERFGSSKISNAAAARGSGDTASTSVLRKKRWATFLSKTLLIVLPF